MLTNNKFWFRICQGEKGKRYYVLSESFWKWIENAMTKTNEFGSKSKVIREIMKVTKNKINKLAVSGWVYSYGKDRMRKPIVISDSRLFNFNKISNGCVHGYKFFCPICKILSKRIENCPVPLLWRTDKKGKIYVFEEFWDELLGLLQNCEKFGLLPSTIYKNFEISGRVFRKWRNDNVKPKLYSRKEFEFTPENLYWLGMHFSDGHLRNNGSKLSFTWQCGSSNPFQGYWFPQFIQNFMDIFRHKANRSLTYVEGSDIRNTWFFKTNISSFSPIFAKFLEKNRIIKIRQDTNISGYSKNLPKNLIEELNYKETLFQGIMDGDGSYNISDEHGIFIALSLDPAVKYDFIESLPLVPTIGMDINERRIAFEEIKGFPLGEIRFAPSSLNSLAEEYTAKNISNQIEFMLKSAENSIRPDKVHKLIKIAKRICSKNYGEYRSCLEIQKEIRIETRKRNLNKLIKNLENRFPISNGFYKPFIPKWAKNLTSRSVWKQEFWDFFLNGEFLIKKNYPKPDILDFSNGVPVDFDMTLSSRN